MLSTTPNLALAREIATLFYRQISPDFPLSENPIHIDSAKPTAVGVEVIWAYFDKYWDKDRLVFGMRFTVVIPTAFWLEQEAKPNIKQDILAA
jgi:hypothetical protein